MGTNNFLERSNDFYFSPRPYLLDLMMKKEVMEVMINGEWKVYTEMTQKGSEPVTDKEGRVYLGNTTLKDVRSVSLTDEEVARLIMKWRKDFPHLAPK